MLAVACPMVDLENCVSFALRRLQVLLWSAHNCIRSMAGPSSPSPSSLSLSAVYEPVYSPSVPHLHSSLNPSFSIHKAHFRRLYDIFHLCQQRGDVDQAKRAYSLLVRCKEFDWATNWRSGILMVSAARSEHETESSRAAKEVDLQVRFLRECHAIHSRKARKSHSLREVSNIAIKLRKIVASNNLSIASSDPPRACSPPHSCRPPPRGLERARAVRVVCSHPFCPAEIDPAAATSRFIRTKMMRPCTNMQVCLLFTWLSSRSVRSICVLLAFPQIPIPHTTQLLLISVELLRARLLLHRARPRNLQPMA